MTFLWRSCLLLLAFLATGSAALAQSAFADRLTGDWGGARTRLAERGATLDLDSTHYYQGLLKGTGDKGWDYGGRLDAYANFDTTKLGLWQGGLIKTHLEYFYGGITPTLGGTALPTHIGVRLPEPGRKNDLVLTNLSLVQRVGESSTLIVGKISTVDLLASDPFFGGLGTSRFLNLALAAPPNGLQPPVIMGGILSLATPGVGWTFMLFDPEDRTHDSTRRLFDTGVAVSGSARFSAKLDGRSSSLVLTTVYSSADGADLGGVARGLTSGGTKKHSWHASAQVGHFLHERADSPGQGWGVFAKIGASDGNPNPFQAFITGGVGGKGLFASRPNDAFGIGYFYYDISDVLQSTIDPSLRFGDEQGVEVFYDFALAPGVRIGADLQFVNPALGLLKNVVAGGLRLKLSF